MSIRAHIRTLALGAALAMSVVGMPAVQALAAAPGSTPLRPIAPVGAKAAGLQVHSTGDPGSQSESVCQQYGERINEVQAVADGTQSFSLKLQAEMTVENMKSSALDDGCFIID